jgi:hypothetical protein
LNKPESTLIRKDFEKNISDLATNPQYFHRAHTYPVLLDKPRKFARVPETDVDFSLVLSGMSRKWLECALFLSERILKIS